MKNRAVVKKANGLEAISPSPPFKYTGNSRSGGSYGKPLLWSMGAATPVLRRNYE
ncbi:unnamed protein product [marine sediment metagenome]|uniref:Uncharacterized protein n=1 Tax=marine sediment metagenome TaxID=412755 RepID=X0Y037_9ZZZZ